MDGIKEQLMREPYAFPQLFINKDIETVEDMEALSFEDFTIDNYISHKPISAPMAV
jgi:thymidylate synthase